LVVLVLVVLLLVLVVSSKVSDLWAPTSLCHTALMTHTCDACIPTPCACIMPQSRPSHCTC